ncbi:28S ribosomal protein S6, mitochondrial [Geodia barretti]|uniref:Small ribosomal subunit protein bS6m n=1 Tax=Geodia barretti TaxID=519541 RepID=A0AA35T5I3_GEOBA|nr:28S ribosomal protein S6, mitochondrial [Geodia barretti]
MVHYELAVIFRTLGKSDLPAALRSACGTLLAQGSIVREMESRGERRLPYKMGAHKERFTHGRYVIFDFDAPPQSVGLILSQIHQNRDVIRASLVKSESP